jgi:hypothetical protein
MTDCESSWAIRVEDTFRRVSKVGVAEVVIDHGAGRAQHAGASSPSWCENLRLLDTTPIACAARRARRHERHLEGG